MDAAWPESHDKWLVSDRVTYPVSFNGKVRFQLELDATMNAKEVEDAAIQHEKTAAQIEGKTIRKVIVVPGRIINIVIG
jgi:leucyl-tRNA synthetase